MNIKGHLCVSRHLLAAIALYLTQQNWKCLYIRNWQYTEFHNSYFGVVSPLGFDIKRNSEHETPKIKLSSVRALQRYLNRKILIYGRETETISKVVHWFLKRTLFSLNRMIPVTKLP